MFALILNILRAIAAFILITWLFTLLCIVSCSKLEKDAEGAKVDQGILERGEWLPDKHITAIDS